MGHMNFENQVKISTKQAVRDMPQIPQATIYKQCPAWKMIKGEF
jgi:hypothetical protein